MKITHIEPIVVGAPTPGCGRLSDRNYIFVNVHTDEGITGLGEATLEGYDQTILGLFKDLEALLIGEDPTRIGYLTQVLVRQKFWKGGVVKGTAVAGIELALWDILGKAAGMPVHRLVGGACRDRIRVYANGWSGGATDPAEIKDKAHAATEDGYRAFKFSLAEAACLVAAFFGPRPAGNAAPRISAVREVPMAEMVLDAGFMARLVAVEDAVNTRLRRIRTGTGAVHPLEAAREHLSCVRRALPRFVALAPGQDNERQRLYYACQNLVADSEAIAGSSDGGVEYFKTRRSRFVRFYRSDADGSLQPYAVSVPLAYAPGNALPLRVGLHGWDEVITRDYWIIYWSTSTREKDLARVQQEHSGAHPALSLACLGRANASYRNLGEQDVLDGIRDMRRHYAVDDDCVTLTGFSMGGGGTWSVAARYPDLFAAISPQAGPVGEDPPAGGQAGRAAGYASLLATPYWRAENLLNVPIYCVHGGKDPAVPPDNSRRMVARLRALGHADVTYVEYPNAEHGGYPPDADVKIDAWIQPKRRASPPTHFRYHLAGLRAGKGYWIRADLLERPGEPALLDASVTDPGRLVLRTANVLRLTILPGAPLSDAFVAEVDGSTLAVRSGKAGACLSRCDADLKVRTQWSTESAPIRTLCKQRGIEGPIGDVFCSRTVLVPGSLGNADGCLAAQRACAAVLAGNGPGGMIADFPVLPDTAVTRDEMRRSNLVLYGNDQCNAIVRRVASRLPVSFGSDTVTIGTKRYSGRGVGVAMVYPNPDAPNRYVLLIATADPAAMSDLARLPHVFEFRDRPDWVAFRIGAKLEILDQGIFDVRWRAP